MGKVDLMDVRTAIKKGWLRCEFTRDYIYLIDTETGERIVIKEITWMEALNYTQEVARAMGVIKRTESIDGQ